MSWSVRYSCERGIDREDSILSINPELAPQDLLFEQALAIEGYQTEDRIKIGPTASRDKGGSDP